MNEKYHSTLTASLHYVTTSAVLWKLALLHALIFFVTRNVAVIIICIGSCAYSFTFCEMIINWVQFKRVYNTVICYNSADTASARRVRETVELLRRETPDLSLLDLWPPNSPNPSTQWTIGYGQPCKEYVYQTPTALKNSYWNSGWWFGSCAVLTRTLSTLALSSSVEDCENRPFRARQLTHCVVTVRLCRVLKYSQPYWRNAKEMLIFSTKLFC